LWNPIVPVTIFVLMILDMYSCYVHFQKLIRQVFHKIYQNWCCNLSHARTHLRYSYLQPSCKIILNLNHIYHCYRNKHWIIWSEVNLSLVNHNGMRHIVLRWYKYHESRWKDKKNVLDSMPKYEKPLALSPGLVKLLNQMK
jgi:hypothetical protein